MKRRAALVLLVSGLSLACATSPSRRDLDIGFDVPEQWRAAETPGGPVEGAWWRGFDDPVLNGLVAEALRENHDLKAAAYRVDAAAALARIAGADRVPSVGVNLSGRRAKQNFIGFPVPGGGDGVPSSTATTLGLSLDTTWELDLWGRLRAREAAALADLDAARAEYEAARLSLTGQTAKVWFALAEARQQVELAQRSVDSFRTTVEQVRSRFERGIRPAIDLRLALTNLHGAESLLEQRGLQYERLRRQLETLLGRYPEGVVEERATIPPVPGPVPAGLPAGLIARRPDLVASERRLAAADERVAEARRALYPSFGLSTSVGTSSSELQDLLDGDFSVWSVVLNLFQPVFQGGRLRANVELSDARALEAAEIYISAALQAYSEVETSLMAEAYLARLEGAVGAASEQAAGARALAEDRYNAGLDDFLTVLEAQRRDLEAESQLLDVRRQRLDARVDLHLSLGGGFDEDEAGSR